MNKVLITKVKQEHGWLSCMSPHPVEYQGVKYRTSEALFQALRFEGYPEVQHQIWEQKSPMAAKMKARKNRHLLNRGERWDEGKDDIPRMKMVLQMKLEQHPELQQKLLDTGDAIIGEDCSTHDRESARWWGMVLKDGHWIGENIFDKIWMEIRDETFY